MPYPNRPPSEVNPNNEPIGQFTGRCGNCGSADLWDDNLSYGCHNCGAWFLADGNPASILIQNERFQ